MHRAESKKGQQSTLGNIFDRFCNSEAAEVRNQVIALLSLASNYKGKERELVDYSLRRLAFFFALLTYFKPTNITRMAAALHEALQALLVRRAELIKFWQDVTLQSYQRLHLRLKSWLSNTSWRCEHIASRQLLNLILHSSSVSQRKRMSSCPQRQQFSLPNPTSR